MGVSGIILAGGRSRRLGIDKTTMPWPHDAALSTGAPAQTLQESTAAPSDTSPLSTHLPGAGEPLATLLEATAAKLAQVCDEVLVVAYRGARPIPYRVVPDRYAEGGSLGGIYSGLAAAANEYAIAVATDMPFLSLPLLTWMLARPRDYDALVPLRDEPEPLHAIYAKRCLVPMRRRLDAGQLKISGFFDEVRVRYVDEATLAAHDPQGFSFFNINTPDDLERARQLLTQGVSPSP